MPRWLPRALARIRKLAGQGRVRFTGKARLEIDTLRLGLSEHDAIGVIEGLTARDFSARLESQVTGESMYVFAPEIAGVKLYLKLVLRAHCVVVSFHGRGPEPNGGDEAS